MTGPNRKACVPITRILRNGRRGDIQGKAAVILTNDGWMHERLFKRG